MLEYWVVSVKRFASHREETVAFAEDFAAASRYWQAQVDAGNLARLWDMMTPARRTSKDKR